MRGMLTDTRRLIEGVTRAGAIKAGAIVMGVAFVSTAWAGAAAAQNTLTMSGEQRTVACEGETLRIVGQKNTVTVTGQCRKVDVSGSNNTVSIESVASIEVTGTNNKITWQRALNGVNPRVSATGLNSVTRATVVSAPPAAPSSSGRSTASPAVPDPSAAPPSSAAARAKPDREPAPPSAKASSRAAGARRDVTTPATTDDGIVVQEDDRKDSIDCDGRQVSILGSRNTLRLRGSCPNLFVTGSDNEIDVDATERIRVSGDRNRILWTSVIGGTKTPRVENTGTQNRISKADRKPVSSQGLRGIGQRSNASGR
jgi:hypothetical protein